MDEYNQMNDNTTSTTNFFYSSPVVAANNSASPYRRSAANSGYNNNNHQIPSFHLQSSGGGGECFQSDGHPILKTEAASSSQFHHYPLSSRSVHHEQDGSDHNSNGMESMKARIISHPQYANLLDAYMDCQKVGAPPEVVARLVEARQELESKQRSAVSQRDGSKDPELDHFMEAYYDMLVKYREELTRPLQEAMEFMRRIENQLSMLTNNPVRIFKSDRSNPAEGLLQQFYEKPCSYDKCEGVGSSEEDQDNSGGETELPETDPRAEDRELKNHLLKKYSGYLSSLKQELSKKRKKGKLPKEGRQKLLSWWELHYKWPYPSEAEKVVLAESTGLDQKQINNWFINQRKRHWKPSEDMQFMVMDGLHPQNAALFMEGHYMGDGPYRMGP